MASFTDLIKKQKSERSGNIDVLLPIMARDMNVMKQGILKLVKLQGGTQRDRADRFFTSAKQKESVYESQYGKKLTSPTPATGTGNLKEEEKKGIFSSIFSGIVSFIPNILKTLAIGGLITALVGKLAQNPEIEKMMFDFGKKLLTGFFDSLKKGFEFISKLLTDSDVQESIRGAVKGFFKAIGDFLSIQLTTFKTPFGEFEVTIGRAIAIVVGSLAAFNGAVFAATGALTKFALGGAGGGGGVGGGAGKGGTGKPGPGGAKGFIRGLGPTFLLGGILYYLNEKGEKQKAPPGTPVPPGTPEIESDSQQVTGKDLTNPPSTTSTDTSPGVDKTTKDLVNLGVAGAGAYLLSKSIEPAKQLPGLAAKTGTAILDARTTSAGSILNSKPTTKWGRFLQFVAKKDGELYKKIAVKLAQSGALMAIPFGGWILSAINLGFNVAVAYQLYIFWKEFNGIETEEDKDVSTTPEAILSPEETNVPARPTLTESPAPAAAAATVSSSKPIPTTPTPVSTNTSTTLPEKTSSPIDVILDKKPEELTDGELRQLVETQGRIEDPRGVTNNPGGILYGTGPLRDKQIGFKPANADPNVKIAVYDTPENGIRASMENWRTSKYYRGKTVREGLGTWSGGNGAHYAKMLGSVKPGYEYTGTKNPQAEKSDVTPGTPTKDTNIFSEVETLVKPLSNVTGISPNDVKNQLTQITTNLQKGLNNFIEKGDPSVFKSLMGDYVVDRGSILGQRRALLDSVQREAQGSVITPPIVNVSSPTPPAQASGTAFTMASVVDQDFMKVLIERSGSSTTFAR
jgi:hypothetical protein